MDFDFTVFMTICWIGVVLAIILALGGWHQERCYICGHRGWAYKMTSDWLSGFGPETAVFECRHQHCRRPR